MVVIISVQPAITAATGISVPVVHTKHHIQLHTAAHRLVRPARLDITAQRVLVARPNVAAIINTQVLVRAVVQR